MEIPKDEWPNFPQVIAFNQELEELKDQLLKRGRRWFALSRIGEQDEEIRAFLNPQDQVTYNQGWFTLRDLRDWLNDEGPVVKTMQLTAIYPHPSGGHQAKQELITGKTREEVLIKAQAACPVTYYLGRLATDNGSTTVWEQSKGWLQENP